MLSQQAAAWAPDPATTVTLEEVEDAVHELLTVQGVEETTQNFQGVVLSVPSQVLVKPVLKAGSKGVNVNLGLELQFPSRAEKQYTSFARDFLNNRYPRVRIRCECQPSDNGPLAYSLVNLTRLAVGFRWLRELDEERRLCKSLAVELPADPAMGVVDHEPRLGDSFFLPAVQDLEWTSHRNQLPLFFAFRFDQPPRALRNCILNVNLTMQDCLTLFRELSKTISYFKVNRLIGNLGDDRYRDISVLPISGAQYEQPPRIFPMEALLALDITSDWCPGQLLNWFKFKHLKHFRISTRHCKLYFFGRGLYGTIPWENLDSTSINGDFYQRDLQKIHEAAEQADHRYDYYQASSAPPEFI